MPGLCPVLGLSTALVHLLLSLIDRWGDLPKAPQQSWAPFRALALPHDTLLPTPGRERPANSAHAMGSCLGNAVLLAASSGTGPQGCLPRPWRQKGSSWVTPQSHYLPPHPPGPLPPALSTTSSPHVSNSLRRGLEGQAGLSSNCGSALLSCVNLGRLLASLYLSLLVWKKGCHLLHGMAKGLTKAYR